MTTRATSAMLLVLALILPGALTTGCTPEFGPGETAPGGTPPPGAARVDPTADAARTKLTFQVQDPCYAGDPREAWPRCARWVEETASSARTAAGALRSDPRVLDGAGAVGAGHDAFLGRGCGTGAAPDPDACVGALLQARDGVHGLAQALGGVPGA